MAEKSGTNLSEIEGFPPEVASRLSSLWVTTAEELVSAAARENGVAGLSDYLSLPEDEVVRLVDQAQAAIPPQTSFDVTETRSFGLGAMDEPTSEDEEGRAALSFAPLPESVNLSAKMPSIRNQGQRGTCVSFACTAVREYLLGSNGPSHDLSEQYLYWSCKQNDHLDGPGTFISIGMERLLAEGECPEECWPYNPTQIQGNESQDPPPADAVPEATPYRITETRKLPARSVDSIRQALAEGSPVAFAVPVYTYWFSSPVLVFGDIRMPLSTDHLEGGHAMCMVGYQDDPTVPGGGYFMIRNSWGTSWASNSSIMPGYARLPYAYIEQLASAAHIAFAAAPAPKPDPKPAPGPVNNGFLAWLLDALRKLFGR